MLKKEKDLRFQIINIFLEELNYIIFKKYKDYEKW